MPPMIPAMKVDFGSQIVNQGDHNTPMETAYLEVEGSYLYLGYKCCLFQRNDWVRTNICCPQSPSTHPIICWRVYVCDMRSKMDNMNILASMYREIDTRSMDDDDDDDDDGRWKFQYGHFCVFYLCLRIHRRETS